jgi:hypothetical protein
MFGKLTLKNALFFNQKYRNACFIIIIIKVMHVLRAPPPQLEVQGQQFIYF